MTGADLTGAPDSGAGPPQVRALALFDAALLTALLERSFPEQPWTEDALRSLLATPGVFGQIAFDESGPLGCLLLRAAVDEAEILWIAVLPEHRRRGIARDLFLAAVPVALSQGVRRLFLEVADDNRPARTFYRSLDFQPVGRRRAYYKRADGPAVDAVIMARSLPIEADPDDAGP